MDDRFHARSSSRLALLICAVCLASGARAQSFNIDNAPVTVPSPIWGGAAFQTGYWNGITLFPGQTVALRGLDGAVTSVTFGYVDGTSVGAGMLDCLPPPISSLLCEMNYPNSPAEGRACRFEGLAEGRYELWTYSRSYDLNTTDGSIVEVGGSLDPAQFVGGPFTWAGLFVLGKTHARHRITVTSDGVLEFRIHGAPWPLLNGMQLVYAGPPGFARYCNPGTTAAGCEPRVTAVGDPSASSGAGFRISVVSAQPGMSCQLFYGIHGRVAIPFAPASASTMCIRSPVQRFFLSTTSVVQTACSGWAGSDWNRFVHSTTSPPLGAPFAAGQTVEVQAWCTDPVAVRGALSDAIEFVVGP